MKQILNKLRSRAGESLVESLAAILIFTMASIGMFSMVTSAADINQTAKEADRTSQEQLLIAEQGEGRGTPGTVTMTLTSGDNTINVIVADVDIYGTEGGLYAYYHSVTLGD